MTRTRTLTIALLLTALASLAAVPVEAGRRCHELCRDEIAACQDGCASLRRKARRRCRATCAKSIVDFCQSAPEPRCSDDDESAGGGDDGTADPAGDDGSASAGTDGDGGAGGGGGPAGPAPVVFDPAVHVTSWGADRTYARSVPADYDPARAYPVVLAFHGDGGTGASLRDVFGLEAQAGGAAILVYPDATEESWRSFDLESPPAWNADMQLVKDILDDLEASYHIDRTRVFATGFSRGGFFANFLNCRLGTTVFRAVAAHSGSGPYGPAADYDVDGHFLCEAPAAAAMMIHGTADGVVPLSDAEYSHWQWTWANGCSDATDASVPAPCVQHQGCAAGKPVAWCAVPGLGHAIWSEAGQAIWSFFAGVGDVAGPVGGGGGGGGGGPAGATMRVVGRDLYDAEGEKVLLRGVNKMNVFTDPDGSLSFHQIHRAGANSVRIVWATATDFFVPTAADLDTVITRAETEQLVPMPELHDATGNLAGLPALVDYWTRPDIAAVIRKHERWVLLNVGNEVGDWEVTTAQFLAAYRDAIGRIRAAGIRTPLVIDGPDYGKNIDVILAAAKELVDFDPEHNLLFSVHVYWPMHDYGDAGYIWWKLGQAADAGVPLVVGEFSRWGAYAGAASMCSWAGEVDYQTVLQVTAYYGIGWYAWEWGPGNAGGGDPACSAMDMTTGNTLESLQPGWATDVVVSSPYGIQAMSSCRPRSAKADRSSARGRRPAGDRLRSPAGLFS